MIAAQVYPAAKTEFEPDRILQVPVWDHNIHFHERLLKQCPTNARHVLDIGCGQGDFAIRLAERAVLVDAIDTDPVVLQEAEKRATSHPNIRFACDDFLEADLPFAHYDMITAIASLHHMDAQKALEKMKVLLRPGGMLAILGLYREKTPADFLFSMMSIPVNWFYLAWHRQRFSEKPEAVRMRRPELTFAQVRSSANALLPGVQIRRHLLWRYSLSWRKPM